jgi:hypothetical protein
MGSAAHLMTHTVTKASKSGRGNSGDPTYGAQSTIKARVEHVTKLVMNADGNEQAAHSRLISESEILLTDRVWLPGDDTAEVNESKQPIAVGHADIPDTGYTLYEAWL